MSTLTVPFANPPFQYRFPADELFAGHVRQGHYRLFISLHITTEAGELSPYLTDIEEIQCGHYHLLHAAFACWGQETSPAGEDTSLSTGILISWYVVVRDPLVQPMHA